MTFDQAAYGFRVLGIDDGRSLAIHGATSWPTLSVEQQIDQGWGEPPDYRGEPADHISDHDASIQTPAAHLLLDRAENRVVVRSRYGVAAADLVHPCLWPAAAVFARWGGAETLHAGAFVDAAGGAWAVLGSREAGKSSLLAALALAGRHVVVDDLLVLDGREGFAGPRCVDLRPEAVAGLGLEHGTSPVRSTQRRRLALGPSDGRFPIHGFVYLAWGEKTAVNLVSPAEHFGHLTHHRRVTTLGANVDQLLELAGLPALRFTRPRSWDALRGACTELLASVEA